MLTNSEYPRFCVKMQIKCVKTKRKNHFFYYLCEVYRNFDELLYLSIFLMMGILIILTADLNLENKAYL